MPLRKGPLSQRRLRPLQGFAKWSENDNIWGGNGPAELSPGSGRAASGENRRAGGTGWWLCDSPLSVANREKRSFAMAVATDYHRDHAKPKHTLSEDVGAHPYGSGDGHGFFCASKKFATPPIPLRDDCALDGSDVAARLVDPQSPRSRTTNVTSVFGALAAAGYAGMSFAGQYLQFARAEGPSPLDLRSAYFDDIVVAVRGSLAAPVLNRHLVPGNGRANVGLLHNFRMQALAIHPRTDCREDRVEVNGPVRDIRIPLHPCKLRREGLIVNGRYSDASANH